jgi:hypothetical protein
MAKLHPMAARLLSDIEAYRARFGTNRTRFGIDAAGDGHFITRLEEGRIPLITTVDRVYSYMNSNTKAVRLKSKASR